MRRKQQESVPFAFEALQAQHIENWIEISRASAPEKPLHDDVVDIGYCCGGRPSAHLDAEAEDGDEVMHSGMSRPRDICIGACSWRVREDAIPQVYETQEEDITIQTLHSELAAAQLEKGLSGEGVRKWPSTRSPTGDRASAGSSSCDDEISDTSASDMPAVVAEFFTRARQAYILQDRLDELNAETSDQSIPSPGAEAWAVSTDVPGGSAHSRLSTLRSELSIASGRVEEQRALCLAQGVDPELWRYRRSPSSDA